MAKAKNKYKIPIELNKIIHWHKKASPAHVGKLKHSLDFIVPEGTAIYAALDGKVVFVKQNSNQGGNSKKYWLMGNRIVIKHKNKEYTAYEHLKYKGSKVKRGQIVAKGRLIGYSGNTGFSNRPHLHFEVFTNPDSDEAEGETLQISFGIPRIGRCKHDE
ncbi:MAG TPA: M23 family metallopeptidase [Candidatus Nanoarchaeia archaeon]|nr:M23 family metallopeptidase [Candidatus Nanoarchaeia archaeon]